MEVLIVVAIIALVSGGVAVAAFKFWGPSQDKVARASAQEIRKAGKAWWMVHDPSVCPSVQQMVDDDFVDKENAFKDPWGKPWRIECVGNELSVYSDGRDRTANTADDIRVPQS